MCVAAWVQIFWSKRLGKEGNGTVLFSVIHQENMPVQYLPP